MKAIITLKYNDKIYELPEEVSQFPTEEDNKDCILYQYEEGNFSCDCNKSMFINARIDSTFPIMKCGDEIELIKIDFLE